jgi:UDP-glucose 4-epimerase
MHVLVTGGAGFIGSHSVEALLAEGVRVTVLDNFSAGKRANLPQQPDLCVIEGDIRDTVAVRRALAEVSHVLHLAAQVSVRASVEQPVESAGHNITGFLNVLDAARQRGDVRVVYASSAAVYGAPKTLPLDETAPCEPTSPYGLEKLVNDQYAAMFRALYGMSVLGLRYFNVYGPRQDPASPYAGVISRFADRLRQDAPLTVFGDGGQTRDFVFVKDVARANVHALRSAESGVINVGTGTSVTLLELIAALAECAARVPQVRFDPPAPGDIRHSAMRPERIRAALGFVPQTALQDGLATLV